MKTKKTVLVAGGSGFIGSWLCQDLLKKRFNVICADNEITGKRNNLKEFEKDGSFSFIHQDITKQVDIDSVDFIFHMASPASPVHYQKYPVETLMANSVGTLNLLNLAKENNAKILYASSSEVYGDPKEHPQKETYWGNVNPNGPRACYDEGKRFSEALVSSFPGVNWTIIRIFNTYGPRMNKNDGRVVPNFVNQAISSKPITIYGDGRQTRSFCYVSDMVEGIERAMFSEKSAGEVINLGNPNEITMLELADIVIRLTDSKSKKVFRQIPTDDPTRRKPDIAKAGKILGWKPSVGIEEGMKSTIKYFRESA
ncbi:MAG: NAD-dependent epimerase/dehydratase [archaeon GW2011_AR5]|nr:MAG: NAD-dependent epimerase/dehydratase [archaeon GW2011_AR5]